MKKQFLICSILLAFTTPVFSQIDCLIENEIRTIECIHCQKQRSFTTVASGIIEIYEGSIEELLGVCTSIMHLPLASTMNRDKLCNNVNYYECQEETVNIRTERENLVLSEAEVDELLQYFQYMPEQERSAVMFLLQPGFTEFYSR